MKFKSLFKWSAVLGLGLLAVGCADKRVVSQVTTDKPTGQSNTFATLNARVIPNLGGTNPLSMVKAGFGWGILAPTARPLQQEQAIYPYQALQDVSPSFASELPVTYAVTNLIPGVVYHARAVAVAVVTNPNPENVVAAGKDVVFGTPAITLNGATNISIVQG